MIGADGRQIDCSIDLSQCDFLGQGSENLLLLEIITTLSLAFLLVVVMLIVVNGGW